MSCTLDIVEAAFRLERDDEAWLAGLREAVECAFPAARTVQTYVSDTAHPCQAIAAWLAETYPAQATGATPDAAECRARSVLLSDLLDDDAFGALSPALEAEGLGEYLLVVASDGDATTLLAIGVADASQIGSSRRASFARVAEEMQSAMAVRKRMRRNSMPEAMESTGALPAVGDAAEDDPEAEARRAWRRRLFRRGRAATGGSEVPTLTWEALMAGQFIVLDQVDRAGSRKLAVRPQPPGESLRSLDEREQLVAAMAGDAVSNKCIALELGMSEGGVARTVDQLLAKLGLCNRADLVRLRSALTRISA